MSWNQSEVASDHFGMFKYTLTLVSELTLRHLPCPCCELPEVCTHALQSEPNALAEMLSTVTMPPASSKVAAKLEISRVF